LRRKPLRDRVRGTGICMKRTLVSLWCVVTAMLLGSFGGSLWISEKNTLAVLCLIGMAAFLATGLLVYTRGEQSRISEGRAMTPLEWWTRKVLNALWVFCVVFVLLYMWSRDSKIALSGASACFVGCFAAALLQRKQRTTSAVQK